MAKDEKGNGISTSNGNGKNVAGAGDDGAADIQFSMVAQYVKDLSFENPRAPESLQKMQGGDPNIKVNVNVSTKQIGKDGYEVTLELSAAAKIEKETMFIAEVVYAAIFHIQNLPDDQLKPALLVECPRLMFPYARRVLSDATRDGGFPPLLIDPIDFAGLYNRQQAGAPAQDPN